LEDERIQDLKDKLENDLKFNFSGDEKQRDAPKYP
jgi:hypothetical protein